MCFALLLISAFFPAHQSVLNIATRASLDDFS